MASGTRPAERFLVFEHYLECHSVCFRVLVARRAPPSPRALFPLFNVRLAYSKEVSSWDDEVPPILFTSHEEHEDELDGLRRS